MRMMQPRFAERFKKDEDRWILNHLHHQMK